MNGMQFFPEQIKVEEFFKSCDVSTIEMAKKKSVKLEMNCQPGITVSADENMLHSVLRNLVTNAIKFSHRGGTVKIGAERLGEKVKFSVSDNGIGIDKERMMKLFRIDATYRDRNRK
jgi:signal transduction histidine kinase